MSSQVVTQAQVQEVDSRLDTIIMTIVSSRSRIDQSQVSDYSLVIVFEAYERTGIWIDLIRLTYPGAIEPHILYQRNHLEGDMSLGRSQLLYLTREDVRCTKRLLKDVHYEPDPGPLFYNPSAP